MKLINELNDVGKFFFKYYPVTHGKTLVTFDRLYAFYQLLRYSLTEKIKICRQTKDNPLSFSFMEVGVYKGGTSRLALDILEDYQDQYRFEKCTMDICDTFKGMPRVDPSEDLHKKGDFADTSLEEVEKYVLQGKISTEVKFHEGLFPKQYSKNISEILTAARYHDKRKKPSTFDFVHLDVDIYPSYLDSLEYLYPKMNEGSVMLFDDYAFETCPGAKKAVDQFFRGKQEAVIQLKTKQAMIIKI